MPLGRTRLIALVGVALAVAPAVAACGGGVDSTAVNLYYAPEQNLQKVVDTCNQQAGGRYRIVYNKLPRDADGQREQMVRRLAANDSGMDVLGLDVTWTAEFAEAGWIKEWTGADKAEAERGTLSGPLASARWKDKLYAAPKNTNVQLLWYRDDLVPVPPKTFAEMIGFAKGLKQQGKPATIVATGAQYEGLVVLYNSMVAGANGEILSKDGTTAVMDGGAITGLSTLHDFATSGVQSASFSNSTEDNVRLEFEGGTAAFEINWPYVYAAMQKDNPELAKHFRWAHYPAVTPGLPGRATIGGYNLAVSTYSTHPAESYAAALCLRSASSQKFSAINDGVPPTIESVYADPDMAEPYPMRDTILAELKDAAVRPITPAYQNVSTVMAAILSPPANIDPVPTANRLRGELQDAIDSKGVLP